MEWRLHLVSCLHTGEFYLVCVLSQKVVKMGGVSCKMESNFRDSKSLSVFQARYVRQVREWQIATNQSFISISWAVQTVL